MHSYSYRHNPRRRHGFFNPRRKRHYAAVHHYRRRRRQHNPFGVTWTEIFKTTGWAIAGGIATRAIPQLVLPQYNTGWMGYGLNLLTAGGLGWAAQAFLPPAWGTTAARGILLGGAVMLAGRIVSDYFGKTLVTFGGDQLLGAYGDPSFDLGIYTPGSFVVPTVSQGPMQKADYSSLLPAPVAAPGKPAAVKAMAGDLGEYSPTRRFSSRFTP